MGFSDLNIHLIDILVIGLLAFGGYRGYRNGSIVQGLDTLSLILGYIIAVYFTKKVYFFMSLQGLNAADLFASLFLAVAFVGAMWVSHVIQLKTYQKLAELKHSLSEKLWGLVIGFIKYLLITGVFMVVIHEVDTYTNFLPKAEKVAPVTGSYRSVMGTATYYLITTISPSLKFDFNKPDVTKKKPIKYVQPKNVNFNDDEF